MSLNQSVQILDHFNLHCSKWNPMKKAAMLLIIIYFNDNEHSRGSQSSQHQSLETKIYHQIQRKPQRKPLIARLWVNKRLRLGRSSIYLIHGPQKCAFKRVAGEEKNHKRVKILPTTSFRQRLPGNSLLMQKTMLKQTLDKMMADRRLGKNLKGMNRSNLTEIENTIWSVVER